MNINKFFIDNFNFEDNRYFYHITSKGIGNIICEEGLCMSDKNYYTSMIEITPEMISNPSEFLSFELNKKMDRSEMVIVKVPYDYGYNFINKLPQGIYSWNEEIKAEYIVNAKYIMGYFDLESKEFMPNLMHCELENGDEYYL